VALGLVALIGGLGAPGALATPEHSFDATLSLEGGCKGEDGVPDPGCPGGQHPVEPFEDACGTAVDRNGDIYVASGAVGSSGKKGRIDVFNAKGEFLSEIKDEHQPCHLAVDSEGNLYSGEGNTRNVVLFKPESYPPKAGEGYSAKVIFEPSEFDCRTPWSVAVDPSNDHLYVSLGCDLREYGSAAEGSPLLREGLGAFLPTLGGIDVSGKNHDLYVTSAVPGTKAGEPENARLYVLDPKGEKIECEAAGFSFFFGFAGVGVDQANGDAYVDDTVAKPPAVRQLNSNCEAIGQLPSPPALVRPLPFASIAVDDPCLVGAKEPCNPSAPYESPNEGYVFVGSGEKPNKSHLYAYAPRMPAKPPEVESQHPGTVTETEAVLEAEVNPEGADTKYRFEYISQADYEADGESYGEGASIVPVPDVDAGAGTFPKRVSAPVTGLAPHTAYRFRLVAANHCNEAQPEALCTTTGEGKPGEEGTDATFLTYGPDPGSADGRGYELVSPPDTNGLTPFAGIVQTAAGSGFPTALVSPDGASPDFSVSFGTEGGALPGIEGGGFHDIYTATRGPEGWQTSFAGLNGAQAPREIFPGGIAPDHRYSFWGLGDSGGTLARGNYLRGPGESIEPIGLGSLGSDPEARGRWIGEGGQQIVFVTGAGESGAPVQLEPDAPSPGTAAVYERSATGPTEVLSLLPGNITPTESASYKGTSPDGTATAFEIDANLYVRLGGTETQLVTEENSVFGGISDHGTRISYLRPNPTEPRRPNPVKTTQPVAGPPQGEIFSYDTESHEATEVGSGDEAVPVNVSPDGSHIYFLSPAQLDGKKGTLGAENLYAWDAATDAIGFIATVTQRDVYGTGEVAGTGVVSDGLGLWADYVTRGSTTPFAGPGADPSRTSADGSTLIFESRAALSPSYNNAGKAEIYRYDAGAKALTCISCTPTGVLAGSDASLQSLPPRLFFSLPPVDNMAEVLNLTPDGQRAFFQSTEPLVIGDTDGLQDVYEWEAPGKGTCIEQSAAFQAPAGGCIYLISGGRSATDDYLYGMSADGSDVVFLSGDVLNFEDPDGTPSLYDARIGGGRPQPPAPPGECLGEACQAAAEVPNDPTPASSSFQGAGNVQEEPGGKGCGKGQRKVRRHGKTHCAKPGKGKHQGRKHKAKRRDPR
jgi:hypothetical protein